MKFIKVNKKLAMKWVKLEGIEKNEKMDLFNWEWKGVLLFFIDLLPERTKKMKRTLRTKQQRAVGREGTFLSSLSRSKKNNHLKSIKRKTTTAEKWKEALHKGFVEKSTKANEINGQLLYY
jgi:hypothetical protein